MKALRLLSILAACCAFGTMTPSAWAAEPAPAKPATPAATPPASKPTNESAAPKADEPSSAAQPSAKAEGTQGEEDDEAAEEQRAATAKPKAPGKGSPERFVPSEQVRADFDVSFPVDI